MNEAVRASPLGTTLFDSTLGWAIRRHCAPLLDLEPLVSPETYLARRTELRGTRGEPTADGGPAGIGTLWSTPGWAPPT